ncbi:MAG: glutathione S-transferase [Rhizobiaceae bacterium]
MKLFDGGAAPNPRRVRIFLAEKGIEIPLEPVDMLKFGHKSDAVTILNPFQRLPVLALDDGTGLSETVAICRYFEELHPDPPLMGVNALDKARVEMWQRRMEFNLLMPIASVFRHTHPAMKEWEVPQIAEVAESNRPRVIKMLDWMNDELADREFIAGENYTIADITGLISIDFMKPSRLNIPEGMDNLMRWYQMVKERPSAKA